MGWRDGTIRDVPTEELERIMVEEQRRASAMLAEAGRRFFAKVRELHEPPGVVEATFRVVEDERMPPGTVAFLGDNGSLVVVDNVGDVRTD
jgi:hypothetical protein